MWVGLPLLTYSAIPDPTFQRFRSKSWANFVAIALVLTLSPCLGRTDEPASKQSNPSNAKPHGPVDKTSQVQPLPAVLVAAWGKGGCQGRLDVR